MWFSIEREEIVKHLTTVCGVVERRQVLPILFNVLLIVEDSQLSLTTTDLEVEIRTIFKVQQIEAGRITVAARKFLDICRILPSRSTLEVQHKNGQLHIRAEYSKFTVSTLPAKDFPNTNNFDKITEIELTQIELKSLLQQTVFCMAHQDVRYYLNGLLIELEKEELHAVATDGHRLAIASLKKRLLPDEGKIQAIIPRKAVLELTRLLEDSDDLVRVTLGNSQIRAEFNGLSFFTKLIDGQFPDYRRVIPIGCEKQLIINREALKQGLARVNILTNDKHHGVRLYFSNSTLQAIVTNLEQESAEEKIETNYEGNSLEIGFNNSYLIELLSIIVSEQVKLEFTDASSGCLITPLNGNTSKYVIMPMRL